MSRDRMTEDAARSVASEIVDIAPAPNRIASMSESSGTATAAQNRDYAEMRQIAIRPAGRAIGWMAFCLES